MLIQPIDYFLLAWFVLAALSTAYVAYEGRGAALTLPRCGRGAEKFRAEDKKPLSRLREREGPIA